MMIDAGHQWATATAPATVSNVAVGFDILGFSLGQPVDRVTVRRSADKGVRLVDTSGEADLPGGVEENTATAGLVEMVADLKLDFGLEVSVEKGVPMRSGLGGSAASAVAGVVAASAVLDRPLSLPQRFHYALLGEQRVCGRRRADNIAPAMLGGLTLIRSIDPLDVVRLPVPHQLEAVVVEPEVQVEVRKARALLSDTVDREDFVVQTANLAGFVAGCFEHDRELIGRSLKDLIFEPQRAHLIPGFAQVKEAALAQGALGSSIAGAGPSVFALHDSHVDGQELCQTMIEAFREAGVEARGYTSPINSTGAYIVERGPRV